MRPFDARYHLRKPCDDFWRYATGAWADKNPHPARPRALKGKFDPELN